MRIKVPHQCSSQEELLPGTGWEGLLGALSPWCPTLPVPLQSLVPHYCGEVGTYPTVKGRAQSGAIEMLFQVAQPGLVLAQTLIQVRELLAAMCWGSELFLSNFPQPDEPVPLWNPPVPVLGMRPLG